MAENQRESNILATGSIDIDVSNALRGLKALRREANKTADALENVESKTGEIFYKQEGAAIFIKGKMILGIHPDNLENNLKALNNGDMKIDWEAMNAHINTE